MVAGAVLNSPFLSRLLTSDEEDFERVSLLKEDVSSTACEVTMLILSISVTFNMTCLTVTSLITKSCRQCSPVHFWSFYNIVHWQVWGAVVDFRVHLVAVNLCLQYGSERTTKIGQYLPKLSSMKRVQFFLACNICLCSCYCCRKWCKPCTRLRLVWARFRLKP